MHVSSDDVNKANSSKRLGKDTYHEKFVNLSRCSHAPDNVNHTDDNDCS